MHGENDPTVMEERAVLPRSRHLIEISREKIIWFSKLIVAVYVVIWILLIATGPGLMDRCGRPKGTDFVAFYAAGRLGLAGKAATAYDPASIQEAEFKIIGARFLPTTWNYPPTFFLIMIPIAALPYLPALLVWLFATLYAYTRYVTKYAPEKVTLWALFAFPGTFMNFFQGQNGFFIGSLLAGGLLLMETQPVVGGALLGAMMFKPQFAWPVFIALIALREWKVLAAATTTTVVTATASALLLGNEVWIRFWSNIGVISKATAQGLYPLYKNLTVFAASRLLGANISVSMLLECLVSVAAVTTMVWVWRRQRDIKYRASSMALCVLLASPSAWDYDLAILGLALVCMGSDWADKGWLTGEKLLLVIGWCMPVVAILLAKVTHVQLGPLIMALMLWAIVRRVRLAGKPLPNTPLCNVSDLGHAQGLVMNNSKAEEHNAG